MENQREFFGEKTAGTPDKGVQNTCAYVYLLVYLLLSSMKNLCFLLILLKDTILKFDFIFSLYLNEVTMKYPTCRRVFYKSN